MSSVIRPPRERPGQPGGRRDTNRREKAKALQDAALALFLERGIEAVTIDDVTKQAGVAKGSFYRYFHDKTALVESLFADVHARLDAAFRASGARLAAARTRAELFAAYEELAAALAAVAFDDALLVQLYLQESRGPAVGARVPIRRLASLILAASVALTEQARTHGLLRPIRPALSALAVVGAVERLLFALYSGEEMGPPLEAPDALISLVLDGLRAR